MTFSLILGLALIVVQVSALSRDELVEKARLADKAGRYDDVADIMKAAAKLAIVPQYPPFNTEDREFLHVGFDRLAGVKRASLKVLSDLESETTDHEAIQRIKAYRAVIEAELVALCTDVVKLVDDLLPGSDDQETEVFYSKMKGDFLRHMAEAQQDPLRTESVRKAEQAYEEAVERANKELSTTNLLRLNLALNYSVFLYETKGEHSRARQVAQAAFDVAIVDVDQASPDDDTMSIMQLLNDKIIYWTGCEENDES